MNCKHCGQELQGEELVCPKCGYILYEEGPKLTENKQMENNQNKELNEEQKVKRANSGKINLLPFLVLFVLAIGLVLYRQGKINLSFISTIGSKKVEFAGYSIPVLRGYETSVKYNELIISNNDIKYYVYVDYTYSFEDYDADFRKSYSDLAYNSCKANIGGTDYFNFSTNKGILVFYTKAKPTYTFVGYAEKNVKYKDRFYTSDDLNDLNKMLSNAKFLKKESDKDIGEDEMILAIWCNELFDKESPDTFYKQVEIENTKKVN